MKTARWIKRTHLFRPDEYFCSVCGRASDRAYTVCPVCGSHMKNVKTDPSWVDEAEELAVILDEDW